MKHGDARTALSRQLARAQSALSAERAAFAALPVALAALVWAAAALAGSPVLLGPLGTSLAAIAALIGLTLLAVRQARTWRRPTETEIRARLERDAALDPGTLASLEDKPARLEPFALALWRKAQADAQTRAAAAKARGPRFEFDQIDRFGARYVAIALVIGGAVLAQDDWSRRLTAAFVPDPGPLVGDQPLAIEAWAAPAPYTGAAPVSLTDRAGERIETPPQVEVTVRVTGPVGAPILKFSGQGGSREIALAPTPDGAWEGRLALPGAGAVSVHRFGEKARWRIAPAPDRPPVARFLAPPRFDADDLFAALNLRWAAEDDYGVRSVALQLTPIDPPEGLKAAPPAEVPLEPPGAEPRAAEGETSIDLTAHAYAGMTVDVRLLVRDALGQEGVSDPVRVTLPEPILNQPLARAALEIRRAILQERRPYAALRRRGEPATVSVADALFGARDLVLRTDDYAPRFERAPPGIRRAVRMLDALTLAPQDGYFEDLAILLGLETAAAALREAGAIEQTDAAADILWHVAQRAEYGDSADATAALERAQRALSAAIQRGASPEEIARLSAAVREAMQDYVTALMQEALREGRVEERQETRDQAALNRSDLDALMREVERLANEGRGEEAQALLRQLAQMLANMEVRLASGPGGEGEGEDPRSRELEETLRDLADATGEQRNLRDDTQSAERGEEADQPGARNDQLAERQSRLQRRLDEMRARAGEGGEGGEAQSESYGEGEGGAAEALSEAGQSMGEAAEALRRGDLRAAQSAQDEALRNLRAGSQALSQELLAREEGRQGEGQSGAGMERDPLGRPIGAGMGEGDDVGLPQEMERQRAREIRDELRRRAQDPSRPERERAYLRRLLERFTGS